MISGIGFFVCFKDFIYSRVSERMSAWEREGQHKWKEKEQRGEGGAGSPLRREPDGTPSQDPGTMALGKGRCLIN